MFEGVEIQLVEREGDLVQSAGGSVDRGSDMVKRVALEDLVERGGDLVGDLVEDLLGDFAD